MHRLFVAIRPPRLVREQLLGLMGGISGARWQTDEQLHITLRFIGEVEGHVAEDVAAALTSIRSPAFEAAIDGIGSFDRRGQPGVIWAGVDPQEPFKALHQKVDQTCVRAGLEPERRSYHPHVTLARLREGAGPLEALLVQSGGVVSEPFCVDAFGLYESILTPEGAVHTLAQSYQLG
jgi:RNA 2',3'-cyclic 3'-phosphodiesterase